MSDTVYISCLGCSAIIDPTLAVCPGCGRCLHCGTKRAKAIESCPQCEVPYCTCCGRCPACHGLRYSDITEPCECGHPADVDKLRKLIASAGVRKPGEKKSWWDWLGSNERNTRSCEEN